MSNSKEFGCITSTDLVQQMVDQGYLPHGTTRFIIDSGNPGDVVRIYWGGFADVNMIRLLMSGVIPEPGPDDLEKIGDLLKGEDEPER